MRPDKRLRQGFKGAPGAKISKRFPCLLTPWRGTIWFLTWGEDRGGSRGQAEGMAWVVCPLLWWCYVQGPCAVPCFCSQHPAFSAGSSEVAVGFCILLSIICSVCIQLFFSPTKIVSLYFVAQDHREVCLGASSAAKGPRSRSQPVSVPAESSKFLHHDIPVVESQP